VSGQFYAPAVGTQYIEDGVEGPNVVAKRNTPAPVSNEPLTVQPVGSQFAESSHFCCMCMESLSPSEYNH
jgi:hypothetical protein